MDRKFIFNHRGKVDVFIAPEPVRVAPEERLNLHHDLEPAVGKNVKIKLLRLKSRPGSGVLGGVVSRVERLDRGIMNRDMVGVMVSADRVESDHHLRLQFTEDGNDTVGHLIQGGGG